MRTWRKRCLETRDFFHKEEDLSDWLLWLYISSIAFLSSMGISTRNSRVTAGEVYNVFLKREKHMQGHFDLHYFNAVNFLKEVAELEVVDQSFPGFPQCTCVRRYLSLPPTNNKEAVSFAKWVAASYRGKLKDACPKVIRHVLRKS